MDASTGWIVVALYALGLGLPLVGLWRAYMKTSRRREAVKDALRAHRDLDAWYRSEQERIMAPGASEVVGEEMKALGTERVRRMEALPTKPGTYRSVKEQVGAESGLTDLAEAVVAARWDFVLVGIGLACSTVASIWATLASVV